MRVASCGIREIAGCEIREFCGNSCGEMRESFGKVVGKLWEFPATSRNFPLLTTRDFPHFPVSHKFPQFPAFSRNFPLFPAISCFYSNNFLAFSHFYSNNFPAFSRNFPLRFPQYSHKFPQIKAGFSR